MVYHKQMTIISRPATLFCSHFIMGSTNMLWILFWKSADIPISYLYFQMVDMWLIRLISAWLYATISFFSVKMKSMYPVWAKPIKPIFLYLFFFQLNKVTPIHYIYWSVSPMRQISLGFCLADTGFNSDA